VDRISRQHELSARERQLIELAAKGHTDAEMAHELGIAVGTVATYWGRIRAKYGGCSRTELVATALEEEYEKAVCELRAKAEELTSRLRRETGETGDAVNLYKAVVDAAPEAILMVRESGEIEYVNVAAEQLFGYSRDELVGQSIALLLPERYRKIHAQHVADYAEHPERGRMGAHRATPARHKSGREFSVLASLSHIETSEGLIVSCFIQPGDESPAGAQGPDSKP
jgi:PAS domain S-box-containing protein